MDRPDPLIAVAALHAIRWNVALPIGKVEVMVSKGFMTLRGQVQWQYQKLTVEQVVRCLWGVKGVFNLIIVNPRFAVVSRDPLRAAARARSASVTRVLASDVPSLRAKPPRVLPCDCSEVTGT